LFFPYSPISAVGKRRREDKPGKSSVFRSNRGGAKERNSPSEGRRHIFRGIPRADFRIGEKPTDVKIFSLSAQPKTKKCVFIGEGKRQMCDMQFATRTFEEPRRSRGCGIGIRADTHSERRRSAPP